MTTWGHAQMRHDLWIRLMSLADELQYIAEQWIDYDLEVHELEDANASMPEQYTLPLESPRPPGSSVDPAE
jgi:hypothetical protein